MNGILIVLLILLAIYAFGFTKPKTKGARGKQNTSAADMDDGAAEDEPGLDYAHKSGFSRITRKTTITN